MCSVSVSVGSTETLGSVFIRTDVVLMIQQEVLPRACFVIVFMSY